MQEKHLFEYAVIRVLPRVEREEFLNVGVILYCSAQRFLQTMFKLDEERLRAFSKILILQNWKNALRPLGKFAQVQRKEEQLVNCQ